MKATDVRVLPALDPGESYVDPAFMLVETELAEDGSVVTTIEHVASRLVGDKVRWQVATIGQSVPLSHPAALEWAVSFAASRNIPIVLERVEIVPRQAHLLVGRVGSIDDGAKRGIFRAVLRVPGEMLPCDPHARRFAIERV